ncbi:hypothetical protein Q9R32_17285 [Actinotalea sp. AC32]|nr:hypothetical protein [Actinotalea sp. AC32]
MTSARALAALVGALLTLALAAPVAPATAARPTTADADAPSTAVTGEVVRLAVENLDGTAHEITAVLPDDGDAVRVDDDALAEVPSGSVVDVVTTAPTAADQDPTALDAGADVREVEVVAAPGGAEGGSGTSDPTADDPPLGMLSPGTRAVHVMSATIAGQLSDGFSADDLADLVRTDVAPYWSASTDGQVRLAVGARSDGAVHTGWDADEGCSTAEVFELFDWSARRLGAFPAAGQRRHTVTYTPRVEGCWFGGIAHIADGGSAWINGGVGSPGLADLVGHELGHTLTLGHSNTRFECAGGPDGSLADCRHTEYGDGYDTMGSATGRDGPLNGAHLATMGLLTTESSVTATGPTTAVLAPVGSGAGTRFLRFTADDGATYVVEHRGAVGADADLGSRRLACPVVPTPCASPQLLRPGVIVHRVDSAASGEASYLLDLGATRPLHDSSAPEPTLAAGASFTTADGSWTVVVDEVGATATVRAVPRDDPRRYVPVGPLRVHDERTGVPPGTPVCLDVAGTDTGVPADATGVVLTVTTVRPTSVGNVVVYPEGHDVPATSTVNLSPGRDVANTAFVALPPSGRICYLVRGPGRPGVVVDLTGYLRDGSGVELTAPRRLEDRSTVRSGSPVTVQVTGRAGVPDGATAVVLNVTAARTTSGGHLRMWAAGAPVPATSTLNYLRGGDRATAAVVALSPDGALAYRSQTADGGPVRVVLDVVGYVTDGAAYTATGPRRVLDTRTSGRVPGGEARTVTLDAASGVPDDATAAVLTVVAVSPTGGGHLRVFPARAGQPPSTSVLNYVPGRGNDVGNLVVTAIGDDRQVTLLNVQGGRGTEVDLVVDVVGYLTDAP